MRQFLQICIVAFLLLQSCSPPPPLFRQDVPGAVGMIFTGVNSTAVDAFGAVSLAVEGEVHHCSIEVHGDTTGRFTADFYAPLGISVGSIRCDRNQGTVVFDEGKYTFSKTQTLDTLPFSWGHDLTLSDLQDILLGTVPASFAERLGHQPDSFIDGKKAISVVWKTDTLDIRAKLRKRGKAAESFAFIYKKTEPFRMVTLGEMRKGQAHKIDLRENDRNYFSIRYTDLKRY
jgi:hypothetical protein